MIMQFAEDEDGDFSLGPNRSRLASLFQGDGQGGDVNQALTYTAPKQPRKTADNSQNATGTFQLIHAATVLAYKLENGNYVKQGKLGCAILGNHETSSYKILLYRGKQVQVTYCNLSPSFVFHVQPNNYGNFYDEKKENWSLNVDSEEALIQLAKQVALGKANSQGHAINSLVIQDLIPGEGPKAEIGDVLEIKYKGWLFTNFTFGQLFESKTNSEFLKFRLGKSKYLKGWNEGLVGTQKHGKRLLIVPPHLAYGSEGMAQSVPPDTALIYEMEVLRVVKKSQSPSPVPEADKKPEVAPRTHSMSYEESIRMRGASISEQLTQSPKKDKAQLISRMAKMGMATLPLQGAIPAQVSSESENEEEIITHIEIGMHSASHSPKPVSKPRSRTNSGSQPPGPLHVSPQMTPYPPGAVSSPYMPPSYGFQPPLGSPYHQFATSVADTHLPLLVTEARSQNTEVRLTLGKIVDKVDAVIHKVDDLRLHQKDKSSAPYMESTVLAQNIERIVQENSKLREDVESRNAKIQSLNDKICDLLERNQRFLKESHCILEQKVDCASKTEQAISNLQQEKVDLSTELSEAMLQLNTLEADYARCKTELKNKNKEWEKKLAEKETLLSTYKERLEEGEKDKNCLKNKLEESEEEKSSLASRLQIQHTEAKESLEKYVAERLEKVSNQSGKVESLRTQLAQLSIEKNSLETRVETLQSQLDRAASSGDRVKHLEAELESALSWQKKYENSKEQLSPDFSAEVRQEDVVCCKLLVGLLQIKKAMNSLYRLLQGAFDASASYTGAEVLKICLQAIKGLTFRMLEVRQTELLRESFPSRPSSVTDPKEAPPESSVRAKSQEMGDSKIPFSMASGNQTKVTLVQESPQNEENQNQDVSTNCVQNDTSVCNGISVSPPKVETIKGESPELVLLVPYVFPYIPRNLAKNVICAIWLAYIVLWIGAWVHDVETSTSTTFR